MRNFVLWLVTFMYKKWPDKEGLVNDEGMPSPTCASLSAVAEGNLVN